MVHLNLENLISNLITSAATFLAVVAFRKYQQVRKTMGQKALLRSFDGPTLFVLPHRDEGGPLPRMECEDIMALNNLINAFHEAGLAPPKKLRTAQLLDAESKRKNNLILFCSSKVNTVTQDALTALKADYDDQCPSFEKIDMASQDGERIRIRLGLANYLSESYVQEVDPKNANGPLDDVAIIMKVHNPWNKSKKLLLIAGVRGIGTWGAAEFFNKSWKELYRSLHRLPIGLSMNTKDFAAIVSVRYQDYDIKGIHLIDSVVLKPKSIARVN